MADPLLLSRHKLQTFLICRRRFQLRYLRQLPWPVAPPDESWREASVRGAAFHRLLEQHFLDLPGDEEARPLHTDPRLARWWQTFQEAGPDLPAGQRLPEVTLTVPIGEHLLTGRFDLLVLDGPAAHIYDWKTESRPRPEAELRDDWQTVLYLALLTEGGAALRPGRQPLDPDQITLTYWFVNDPAATVTIPYSRPEHHARWQQLQELGAEIEAALQDNSWPKTDDWSACARCAYQIYCNRVTAPVSEPVAWEWEEMGEMSGRLEPERP